MQNVTAKVVRDNVHKSFIFGRLHAMLFYIRRDTGKSYKYFFPSIMGYTIFCPTELPKAMFPLHARGSRKFFRWDVESWGGLNQLEFSRGGDSGLPLNPRILMP